MNEELLMLLAGVQKELCQDTTAVCIIDKSEKVVAVATDTLVYRQLLKG